VIRHFFSAFFSFMVIASTTALASPVRWEANNHYYDFVFTGTRTNWTHDLVDAAKREFDGMTGYMATITSYEENLFILNSFGNGSQRMVFLGGRDLGGLQNPPPADQGKWVWYNGPEEGIQFYQEYASPPEGGEVTPPYFYAAWEPGQPNRPDVHYLAMSLKTGTWYDTNNGGYTGAPKNVDGYIIEYGTVPVPGSILLLLFGLGLLIFIKRITDHCRGA